MIRRTRLTMATSLILTLTASGQALAGLVAPTRLNLCHANCEAAIKRPPAVKPTLGVTVFAPVADPVAPSATGPRQALEALQDFVEALIVDDALEPARGEMLLGHLDEAIVGLRGPAVRSLLVHVLDDVDEGVSVGDLDISDAATISDSIRSVIGSLD